MQKVTKQTRVKRLEAGRGNSHVGIEISLWDVDAKGFREGDTVEVQIRRVPANQERERRVVKFKPAKGRYEIRQEGPIFVGYIGGFPCVLASKHETVARMLAERFMGDEQRGKIVAFPRRR